jgi:hypothetical protein
MMTKSDANVGPYITKIIFLSKKRRRKRKKAGD